MVEGESRAGLKSRAPKWLGFALGVALTSGIGALLLLDQGGGLARLSYDLPFLLQNRVPSDLVMVYIDNKSKINLGEPTDRPLDRRFHAQLLRRLQADGAKLVLFDLLFDAPGPNPESDKLFAEAVRAQGGVVLVADYVKERQGIALTESPIPPIPLLQSAAAGWGIGRVDLDAADFSVRRIDTGSDGYPSASWVAAGLLGAASVKDPASRLQTRWLNYYCIPRDLPAVNFDHAVSAGLLPGYFKGKIVVVGLRPEVGQAESARDQFGNPYYRFGFSPSPGAAVHAFSLLNLVHGDWLNALAFRLELLIAVAWGCAITLLFMRLSPWRAIGAALICSAGLAFASSYCQFRYRFWFPWAVPALVQTFFALVWAVGYRYTVESARRRKLRRAFAAYASPYMADQIANSDFDPAPGGKVVEATVMFTDLEGFTNMSEQLLPSELSRILISYFSLTTRAIFEQDGIVIKYIGDAVMAAWGAPVPDPNHAQRAVIAAWGMYQAGLREIEGRKFRTRFGINTGTVLAGNLGSDVRFDFTLIGDATNVGQRLEGLNKYLRTDILISESTRARAGDRIQTRNLGPFIVAGRTSPIEVHEVLGVDGTIVPPEWIAIFSQARQRFVAGDFARAADLFREVIRFRGGQDGPSQFFLEKIAERAALGSSSAAWDGVIRVETK